MHVLSFHAAVDFLGRAVILLSELKRVPSSRQIIPLTGKPGSTTTSGSVTVEVNKPKENVNGGLHIKLPQITRAGSFDKGDKVKSILGVKHVKENKKGEWVFTFRVDWEQPPDVELTYSHYNQDQLANSCPKLLIDFLLWRANV